MQVEAWADNCTVNRAAPGVERTNRMKPSIRIEQRGSGGGLSGSSVRLRPNIQATLFIFDSQSDPTRMLGTPASPSNYET